ncbi:LacI family DNA-binding transcriptional regulator [Paracoccus methylarcula]|nr:LacI family DNA-binding transcriptional regulator [Paracoccus methylarcula]
MIDTGINRSETGINLSRYHLLFISHQLYWHRNDKIRQLIMNRKKNSITVADVARAANVSKATAARVLGGYGVASESTRRSVIEAADRLGYQPNELARSMSTGRTGLIGVVVGDIENAFFSRAVRGISDTARAAGLNVVIANSGERPEQEREMVSVLLRQRVAGLIVAPTDDRDVRHLKDAIKAGTPVVTLDRWVPDLGADGVCGGDHAAATEVMEHLLVNGHRRIAYVTAVDLTDGRLSDLSDIPISAVRERVRGFMDAMHGTGIANSATFVRGGAVDSRSIDGIIDGLLTDEQRFTAILASDSLIGAEIYRSLSARGIRLPKDMSLVSWFDADWTRVTSPPVSIIDQPTYLFGQTAVKRLIARLEGQAIPPDQIVIPTPFIARGSTGKSRTTG